jgi:hypothetical protein
MWTLYIWIPLIKYNIIIYYMNTGRISDESCKLSGDKEGFIEINCISDRPILYSVLITCGIGFLFILIIF